MAVIQKIAPCLWFDGQAEEAAKFYTSIFPNSRITSVSYYGEAGPGPKGSAMVVMFRLAGQEFMALNGGPQFKFNPAVSFLVHCKTQKEVDMYWDKLTKGGQAVQCGWLTDRYGVSWQIVPDILNKLVGDRNPKKAQRAMEAMLQMKKIDIAGLKKAHAG
jgi:predicted 3-demethylubiquinone-9 3-methyltransferase (glyoxalase superfamily)